MLVRGIGSGLDQFGVPGTLADTVIEVFDSVQKSKGGNDDWGSVADQAALEAARFSVGAFPILAGSADASVVLDLEPGLYTAVISGKGDDVGVALLEVYFIAE